VSDDNVVKLIQPGILTDRLTEVLRDGARALLTQAVEAEVSEFLAASADLKTDDGCRRVVRHGHLPERQILTGVGPVAVRQPRVRDREAGADDSARIRFTPAILPPYARRSKSLDTLIPVLYLKGVSSGDFAPALAALLGKDAPGLSAATIARLKDVWIDEHKQWSERDLSARATSMSGPTASTFRRVWRTRRNASWSSSAPRRRARRSCSALSTARERALTTGAPCCSISSAGVCRWRPRSPSPMARLASGRRSARSGPRTVSNDAGCSMSPRPNVDQTSVPIEDLLQGTR
jgi:Transposase, Mutator family